MPHFPTADSIDTVLANLGEALDLVDFGVILLRPDMRVSYINRRITELVSLPAELLASAPTYRQLMDHGAAAGWYPTPEGDLLAYLDQREAEIRAGSVPRRVVPLADTRHVLFRCIACPDGGRILTYTDISRELRQGAVDALEQSQADSRFNVEIMETQAAHLASIAETAEDNAQRAEAGRVLLEAEIAERRQLEVRLRQLATTDGLTGALNRSEFLALGQHETELASDFARDLVVLMVDVDHFKAVNDKYGHAGGDCALRHLVALLRAGIRQVDLLGRLGGEEFAIVLPGAPLVAAQLVAERLRARLADTPALFGDMPIPMTISIGLAVRREADRSIEQIIARADEALYRAKDTGRNRLVTDQQMEAA